MNRAKNSKWSLNWFVLTHWSATHAQDYAKFIFSLSPESLAKLEQQPVAQEPNEDEELVPGDGEPVEPVEPELQPINAAEINSAQVARKVCADHNIPASKIIFSASKSYRGVSPCQLFDTDLRSPNFNYKSN